MMRGHGTINFWGFSPPINYSTLIEADKEEICVVQIGAGDPRNILKTLAESKRKKCQQRIKIYVIESQAELYGRLLLILGICLRKSADDDLMKISETIQDVWMNLYISESTHKAIMTIAKKLMRDVTEPEENSSLFGVVSAAILKFKERDDLDLFFRSCLEKNLYNADNSWDLRLREYFGVRYDYRKADSDWAWYMRLLPRLESIIATDGRSKAGSDNSTHPKASQDVEGKVEKEESETISREFVTACWSKEFIEWRMSGCTRPRDEADNETNIPNPTLSLIAKISSCGKKHLERGFWGDILVGPVPSLASSTENEFFAKKKNAAYSQSGEAVYLWNMRAMLHELWTGRRLIMEKDNTGAENGKRSISPQGPPTQKTSENDSGRANTYVSKDGARGLSDDYLELPGIQIVLLSPTRLKDLSKITDREIEGTVDVLYVSAALAHILENPVFCEKISEDSVLVVDRTVLFPDLSDDQVKDFDEKVATMAEKHGWKRRSGESQFTLEFLRC